MSERAEEAALKAYPVNMTPLNYQDLIEQFGGKTEIDVNTYPRRLFQQGYEQAEEDTIERIISYLGECDLKRTVLDFDRDGYANIHFESLEKLIRKAMEEE